MTGRYRTTAQNLDRDGVSELTGRKRGGQREITSTELLGGSRELQIRHANEIYTLRQTSKGKLILTK